MNRLIYYILTFFLLIGCHKPSRLDDYAVKDHEKGDRILIVIDDDLWLGKLGDTVRSVLAHGIEGIVPFEPMFELEQQSPNSFLQGTMTRKNIIYFPDFRDSSQFYMLKNRHSNPQNYFVIEGIDKQNIIENFINNKDSIIRRFHHQELEDLRVVINSSAISYTPYLKERYRLNLNLPKSYKRVLVDDNFLWFKKDVASGNSNILTYSIKKNKIRKTIYEEDFIKNFAPIRDSIIGKYVHSIEPNSKIHMNTVDYRYGKKFEYKNSRILEIKGTWDMKNSFMSGPYSTYIVDNNQNDYYIIFEGFAYNPSMRKKRLMLEIEAILRSLDTI